VFGTSSITFGFSFFGRLTALSGLVCVVITRRCTTPWTSTISFTTSQSRSSTGWLCRISSAVNDAAKAQHLLWAWTDQHWQRLALEAFSSYLFLSGCISKTTSALYRIKQLYDVTAYGDELAKGQIVQLRRKR